MSGNRIFNSLLFKIIVGIILGCLCSLFFPEWLARVFVTFNGLFSGFLGFFVPVLIFGLITPAIASLGQGAGKWLGVTAGVAYLSTIISGAAAYLLSQALYPTLLATSDLMEAGDIDKAALSPYFSVEMPAPFEVMPALLLAFTVGIAMATLGTKTLTQASVELRDVIMKVVEAFIIPLLPIYIFGVFLSMGMNGVLLETVSQFAKVLVLAIVMTWVVLLVQYLIAAPLSGRNPFVALKNMLPAYFTALGTSSSAATIPVTLKSTKRNGVSDSVADFVIPLCATIHLSGSMMKISLFAFAVVFMSGSEVSAGTAIGFILLLGIMMVAAPGVPGGAIMAAVGLLQSNLGFDEGQVAIMIAAYIAIDSFGTACNVTGDGAIAMVVNKLAKGDLQAEKPAELAQN
ncbi:dicarboxylate/amino acid:cation symporter [Corynebacterium sp. 320]|uniref:Dicarboxylate/amino acid:cation symporter n=1 Tax=Corynebacterium zhongnanshanii TaxID=2768834 RepID=A0ABQ6VEL4_9CORY|nr:MULTISPECIES: dicarboxylate/amino acid:cation symporter [Corynebacterium]KAB1504274.1 dicarboxylate/amino acid:cation symporter [Corynebacterium sp. 320]KAB1552626.1 dicarboxylate/amino acid:cation symporter [Corynebacterium sp. 321]KAB1554156.1 dicarboxylate/amino acid:cation symporter [Corynebacterium sp. 319]KAB3522870.1 dicarboxylate/amino acid:cation symporter [Corynebacterium zhongnanshanii]KAB3528410.1 dicarboxylate/amino acid:cation symporter [Corynebacterium sp. 250]